MSAHGKQRAFHGIDKLRQTVTVTCNSNLPTHQLLAVQRGAFFDGMHVSWWHIRAATSGTVRK